MAILFGDFNKHIKNSYDKQKDEGKSGLQIFLTGFFVVIIILVIIVPLWAASSWCFAWLWNVAAAPFGAPTLTWLEFGCGWIVLMLLQNFIKNCFKK